MKMLCSLSSTQQAARHCFNLLKHNSPVNTCFISWDHFFTSLNRSAKVTIGLVNLSNKSLNSILISYFVYCRYYFSLRQEPISKADTVYHRPMQPRGITLQEIQGLQAVLSLIRAVAGKTISI